MKSKCMQLKHLSMGIKACLKRSLIFRFFLGKVIEEKNCCYHQQSATVEEQAECVNFHIVLHDTITGRVLLKQIDQNQGEKRKAMN